MFLPHKFVHKSNALRASALHRFVWVFKQFGQLQNGKCITVQATAAGRRRKGAKRGKRPLIPGIPEGDITEMHSMNVRNVPKGKRAHGLAKSITHGTQNAGKWQLSIISFANNFTRILTIPCGGFSISYITYSL